MFPKFMWAVGILSILTMTISLIVAFIYNATPEIANTARNVFFFGTIGLNIFIVPWWR